MNKEIIIKTTLKKEVIKSIICSLIISIIQSYIFYITLDTGVRLGRQNETLKEISSNVVIVLMPILFIACVLFFFGKMVGKGYFEKGGNQK